MVRWSPEVVIVRELDAAAGGVVSRRGVVGRAKEGGVLLYHLGTSVYEAVVVRGVPRATQSGVEVVADGSKATAALGVASDRVGAVHVSEEVAQRLEVLWGKVLRVKAGIDDGAASGRPWARHRGQIAAASTYRVRRRESRPLRMPARSSSVNGTEASGRWEAPPITHPRWTRDAGSAHGSDGVTVPFSDSGGE